MSEHTDRKPLNEHIGALLQHIEQRAPYIEATIDPATHNTDDEWIPVHRGRAKSAVRALETLRELGAGVARACDGGHCPGAVSRGELMAAIEVAEGLHRSSDPMAPMRFLRGFAIGDPACQAIAERALAKSREQDVGPEVR